MSGADDDALPVFVNTTELHFRLNEKSQAKMFTLYNPYGHMITYKILSTATRNYTINETSGILQAKCCQDM
uniref:Motile sperm domain-containing protein 1 n=1 Tax=Caenorhabditis japonica TaxID=281687 RepID=A0A8R1IMP1_CAEJA